MYDQKLTNPKDHIGSKKLPLHLVPVSLTTYAAMGMAEGALKYGSHNYKICGVRASIYFSATLRHLWKWWSGEWADPKTKVPHLASAVSCLAIILDARLLDKLNDDRPPVSPGTVKLIDESAEVLLHLKEEFKDEHPYHYTIVDTEVHVADPVNGPKIGIRDNTQPIPEDRITVMCGCGDRMFTKSPGDMPVQVQIGRTIHREGAPCYQAGSGV